MLPKFFEIESLTAAMAIWFHEAWWILNPNSTYEQVVGAEQIFQAYIEDKSNLDKAFRFVSLIGNTTAALFSYSVKADLSANIITREGKLSEPGHSMQLTPRTLLGQAYINCISNCSIASFYESIQSRCASRIGLQASYLQSLYPQSNFIRYWGQKALDNKTIVNIFTHNHLPGKFPDVTNSFYDSKCYFKQEVIDGIQPSIECYSGNEKFELKNKPALIFSLN